MNIRSTVFALLAALFVLQGSLCAQSEEQGLKPASHFDTIAKIFAVRLADMHVESKPIDDSISLLAVKLYVSALDSDHSIFTASDVAGFEERAATADDELRKGNVDLAYDIMKVYRQRVGERVDHVGELLARGFDFEKDEDYGWDRGELSQPWPETDEAQNELWRKKIKDQYIRRIVNESREEDEDPEENVVETNVVVTVPDGSTNAPILKPPPTPEEYIGDRYQQFYTIVKDRETEAVFQLYLSSFAQAFDPHSDYLSPTAVEDFDISMKLSLVGIGAMLSLEDGAAKVVRLITGGPAETDGRLQPGDKIIAVAQDKGEMINILHWPLSKIVRKIRGGKGTRVVIRVIPAADPTGSKTADIDIVRDEVRLEEQAASKRIIDIEGTDGKAHKVGIIDLPKFYGDMEARRSGEQDYKSCARDVRRLLTELKIAGVEGVILDLRNNGGGSLNEVVKMTGYFISLGPVVQVKDKRVVTVMKDRDPSVVYKGPLIVLVNKMSASASEIIAGALQDYGRAIIVGDTNTHGKGTVQSVISLQRKRLDRHGSLKITTAGFFRFTGESTQAIGVSSDIVIPSYLDSMDIGEASLENPLSWGKIQAVDFENNSGGALLELLLWGEHGVSVDEYQGVVNRETAIAKLKPLSEERRLKDERFVARRELLQRLKDRRETNTVTLNLEKRRARMKEELRLVELQKDSEKPTMPAAEEDEDKLDIVLEETVNILLDFILMEAAEPAPAN